MKISGPVDELFSQVVRAETPILFIEATQKIWKQNRERKARVDWLHEDTCSRVCPKT